MGKIVLGIVVALVAAVAGALVAQYLRTGTVPPIITKGKPEVPPLAAGWKWHEVKSSGFSIQLPVEFTGIDPKSPELKRSMAEAIKVNPRAETVIRQAMMNGNFVFWAFDFRDMRGSFAKNVNVLQASTGEVLPKSSDEVFKYRSRMESALPPNAKIISLTLIDLPTGPTLYSELEFQLQNPSGPQTTHSFSFLGRTPKHDLTITFTCLDQEAKMFAPIVEKAMRTFRILD